MIFGNGEQSRDFTYVANAVEASMLAIDAPEAPGRVYNVGCGERVSINQLLTEVRALLGSDHVEPVHLPPRPADMEHTLADMAQDTATLEWTSQISADLARAVTGRLLEPCGLKLGDVAALLHANLFKPVLMMKERRPAIRTLQG